MNDMSTVLIVYFSGTGGTKRIAKEFYNQLQKTMNTKLQSLDLKNNSTNIQQLKELLPNIKTVILLYCVHEMDAPKPVFEWIEAFP
jgi:flavodoxin